MTPGFKVTKEMAERTKRIADFIMDRMEALVTLALGPDYECILIVVKKDDPVSLGIMSKMDDYAKNVVTLENALVRIKSGDFHDISRGGDEVH